MNSKQYNQAHHTPFGSGLLATLIGRQGDTPSAFDLLKGISLPTHIMKRLLPETALILNTLMKPTLFIPENTIEISEIYVPGHVRSYIIISLGRHVGHYKAVIKDQFLSPLHAQMMTIPFQIGFAPTCWTNVIDIMLEKEPGNARCHCLCIIALFDQAKRILVGRKLIHHMADTLMMPSMQYGSTPGKQYLSAVLKKILAHDYVRLTKTTAAFIS